MKNTMKKLLCMALAIMLLVSAVPVFAAADGVCSYRVKQRTNGVDATVKSGTIEVPATGGPTVDKVIGILGLSDVTGTYYVGSAGATAARDVQIEEGSRLDIRLVDVTTPVDEDNQGGDNQGEGGQGSEPDPTYSVKVSVKVGEDDSDTRSKTFTDVKAGTPVANYTTDAVIKELVSDYSAENYSKGGWWIQDGVSAVNQDTVVSVRLTPKEKPEEKPSESEVKKHLVRFLDFNGDVAYKISVEDGKTIGWAATELGVDLSKKLTEAKANVPAGYEYKGWDYNATEKITAPKDIKVSYTAKATCTLTLSANGGTFNGSASSIKRTVYVGESFDLESVTAPEKSGSKFAGWLTDPDGGTHVGRYVVVDSNTTLYADWNKTSQVKVYAAYYKNGIWMTSGHLVTLEAYSGKNLYNFLDSNRALIESKIPAGYTWGATTADDDNYFYTYNNDSKLTQQNETANASKSVYIRIYSLESSTVSKVLLYVHTKVGGTATVYDMRDFGYGYVPGDQVTRTQVKKVLDKKYNYSSFGGPYDDTAWDELCDGKTPTVDPTGVVIPGNGTFAVHVVLKNSSTKSSGTADSSNPKTGDTIYVPVMIMGAAATALAAAYVFGKKRIAR